MNSCFLLARPPQIYLTDVELNSCAWVLFSAHENKYALRERKIEARSLASVSLNLSLFFAEHLFAKMCEKGDYVRSQPDQRIERTQRGFHPSDTHTLTDARNR